MAQSYTPIYCCHKQGQFCTHDHLNVNLIADPDLLPHLLGEEEKITRLYIDADKCSYETTETRKILVSWMFAVCEEYHTNAPVFQTAVWLTDMVCLNTEVDRSKLQLTGTAALHIASKLRDCYPIPVAQLAWLTENSSTVAEILDTEQTILKSFNWWIPSISPADFVCPLLLHLGRPPDSLSSCYEEVNRNIHRALFCYNCMQLSFSELASAAVGYTLGLQDCLRAGPREMFIFEACVGHFAPTLFEQQ
ncbi:cyclin D-like protein [Cricetid gammaherpesvirus 2]|uniref:Cyclin D-like protein n=1 Tax=Cricetid gammaherpesvirus 2 TaxID=1605972 RepID=E9M5Q4_9GAMA|nr:cyclin D-like protein [Cricetid gammaherpesvirus 2]ADW24412.1 cyclin D-like protein [Cricetid gammaherpesvirus 2]ADW24494.1 cyclin D-like protein [Cricetid gammaherpesvirus 2]